jgi:hypothetical protein
VGRGAGGGGPSPGDLPAHRAGPPANAAHVQDEEGGVALLEMKQILGQGPGVQEIHFRRPVLGHEGLHREHAHALVAQKRVAHPHHHNPPGHGPLPARVAPAFF